MQLDTMEKKKFSSRLQLLNESRSHYLNYLRNITSQVILLSIILVMWKVADFSEFGSVIIFMYLLGAFFLAVYASGSLLLEDCFSDYFRWRDEKKALLGASGTKVRFFRIEMIKLIWRERFVEFFELSLILLLPYVVFTIVIILAVSSSANLLRVHFS
ncbi:hypothetical protein LH427_04005 [Laribacter hongkongensis]|uniref:hypothetical protein n=1 Tax=Laribacter hongkongensis TaxID=168471 RepID=UPI001EFE34EB|nr:hypothetical protein [Laribacter hongkongensis]MCG8991741.1 hypothetical protein [Laribacter hongkongensis]MCG8998921.1 hypothetical protein [Laribacter hongkongensis]MCG9000281.1 hypothetical protein [Laribacter hongkongensis]MCG9004825.1 hypothetical protein [Laribacter hongkongensis]MCG9006671.1 hypothetical protein [Laribacter hongkongensis]